jgi:hypothetical protein
MPGWRPWVSRIRHHAPQASDHTAPRVEVNTQPDCTVGIRQAGQSGDMRIGSDLQWGLALVSPPCPERSSSGPGSLPGHAVPPTSFLDVHVAHVLYCGTFHGVSPDPSTLLPEPCPHALGGRQESLGPLELTVGSPGWDKGVTKVSDEAPSQPAARAPWSMVEMMLGTGAAHGRQGSEPGSWAQPLDRLPVMGAHVLRHSG